MAYKKVFELTIEQLQDLHEQTECAFFGCADDGITVVPTMAQRGDELGVIKYLYGVDRFTQRFPDINIDGLTQIDFIPQNIDDGI